MSMQITHYARKTLPKFFIFVLLIALATLVSPRRARAAPDFTVNSAVDDIARGDLTNGVCETQPGNGFCTLRAAIMKANHFPGGGVTIHLDNVTYQLNLAKAGADDETTGDLNISNSMGVYGVTSLGTIISGGGVSNDRVFHVMAGILTLSRVTVQNGNCGPSFCGGGGILVDSYSALDLNESRVNNNASTLVGGGIANLGSVTLNYSAVTGNNGLRGAGIYTNGNATLTNSTIDGNIGVGFGVGGGIARIYNSTVSDNLSAGVYNDGGPDGRLIVVNSTVFGNSTGGNGGGILNRSGATTSLYNVTIAYNSAGTNKAGGGVYNEAGTINFQNTIIAHNNHLTNTPPFGASDDCGGLLTSYDYNLIYDATGCTIGGTTFHDKIGFDPNFGNYGNNGGATQTLALLSGSAAIDAGNPGGCGTENLVVNLTTDQRGYRRPFPIGGRCDIGAFEYGSYFVYWLYLPLTVK